MRCQSPYSCGQHTAATRALFARQIFVPGVLQCAAVQSTPLSPPSPLPGRARPLQRLAETWPRRAVPSRPANSCDTWRRGHARLQGTALLHTGNATLPSWVPALAFIRAESSKPRWVSPSALNRKKQHLFKRNLA